MSPASGDAAQRRAARHARQLVGWLAVAAHVLLGLPAATLGLVVPAAAHLLLVALWGALVVVVWRLHARRPLLALLVPVGYVVAVIGLVSAGEALLGWTA